MKKLTNWHVKLLQSSRAAISMRQIIIDTETTGLSSADGHRITEIGCVELIDRKTTGREYQCYINPERQVDSAAVAITGLTNEFLASKPLFADIVDEFIDFIGTDRVSLIAHNASFDMGFLKAEFAKLDLSFADIILRNCEVIDTLKLARERFPGQRNSLDALCTRYDISSFNRDKHGALLDSQILAEVYLRLTGGQNVLFNEAENIVTQTVTADTTYLQDVKTPVLEPSDDEQALHEKFLDFMEESNKIKALWRELQDKA